MNRLIDLQTALDLLEKDIKKNGEPPESDYNLGINHARAVISAIPSAQPEQDCISRKTALESLRTMQTYKLGTGDELILVDKAEVQTELMMLPSAQTTQITRVNSNESLDCISRQEAIDAVIKRDANCGIDSAEVLRALPSAQSEIIRCKDCKYSDWYETINGERMCHCLEHDIRGLSESDYCSYSEREQESKKWEFIGFDQFQCPNCGAVYKSEQIETLKADDGDQEIMKYCHDCGQDLRGGWK